MRRAADRYAALPPSFYKGEKVQGTLPARGLQDMAPALPTPRTYNFLVVTHAHTLDFSLLSK